MKAKRTGTNCSLVPEDPMAILSGIVCSCLVAAFVIIVPRIIAAIWVAVS